MWYFLILIWAVASDVDSSLTNSFSSAARSSREKRDVDNKQPWEISTLPDTIEPTLYDLNISPHFYNNGTQFYGNVSIEINILNRTNVFIVHMKQLKMTGWKVFDSNEVLMRQNDSFYWEKNDYFVMRTVEPLQGKARLMLLFEGNMTLVTDSNFSRSGMYHVLYANDAGRVNSLLVTNFGPNNARYVFPNFDEPRYKARFRVNLYHYKTLTALSNMPVEKYVSPDHAAHYTVFKLSPKMSSYQVAFAITDFAFKNKTVDGKEYRVWAQTDRVEKVDYALNVTPTIQNYLQQELDMSYSLEKLDQLAVPGQLLSGPTENWGLITYSESTLLYDATKGGDFARHDTLTRIAHTLAHNYFGNLVTCRYWQHVWLNEGLATFYQVGAVTAVDPTYLHKEYLYGMRVESAMDADAAGLDAALMRSCKSSCPEKHNFDFVLRYKGAAIMRMVENHIGADKFRSGIRQYIKKHANDTVVTNDLWDALQKEHGDSQPDISTMMTNWVELNGIPVVKVELLPGEAISASQTQFLSDPLVVPNDTYKWFVPLTYRSKSGIEKMIWMMEADVIFETSLNSSDDWIEFNFDRTGYYRVNYDKVLLERIVKQLNKDHMVFSELSRTTLLSDAVALAHADMIDYDAFLNLATYASKENGLVPWLHIYAGFNQLHRTINTTRTCCLQSFLLNLTSNLMDELQVKNEGSYIQKQLRPRIMSLSCSSGHTGCIENTTRVFKAWIEDETTNAIPKEYLREVYCIGMAHSLLESDWRTTFDRFKRATSKRERTNLLRALTCSRNVTLLESLLDFSIQNTTMEKVRFAVPAFIGANPSAKNCVWNWLKRKYAEMDLTWGKGYAGLLLPLAAHSFNTREQYQEVLDFYEVYPDVTGEEKNSTKTVIDTNIQWMERHSKPVAKWLDENGWV